MTPKNTVPAWLSATVALSLAGAEPEALPGTALLDWTDEDPSVRIMDGAHAFVERKIAEAAARVPALPLAEEARAEFVAESRASLARKLGVVDERSAPRLEFFAEGPLSFEGEPPSALVSEGPGFRIHQVRWQVLPGVFAEGLYVNPLADEDDALPPAAPCLVLLPDADETPEDVLGLTDRLPAHQRIGLRFALAGFRILVPDSLDRSLLEDFGEGERDEAFAKTEQSRREWIYRQAFQMGRHPLGYEVQTILAAVDWFGAAYSGRSVAAAGYGEGGRAALYAAALDTRIASAFVSGAFAPRDRAWAEPIDRNLFELLPEHGDASVAALVAPRVLLVEHTAFPEVADRKGEIATPPLAEVEREWQRVGRAAGGFAPPPSILFNEAHGNARGDYPSVAGYLQATGLEPDIDRAPPLAFVVDGRVGFDPAQRQRRILLGLQSHVQRLVDESEDLRAESFLYLAEPALRPGEWSTEREHPTLEPDRFVAESETWRARFEREVIGAFDEEPLAPNPRTRKLGESGAWTMWEVGLDVFPEFEAWGVLLLPKGIAPGERRPVVVCQHGRNGVPRDCIDAGKPAYNDFAARLAERGYIAFAPHALYRHEDRYRWLDRKANLVGGTLFSFVLATHRQCLAWLRTLPEADPGCVAFYGLSYGGEAALRIPAAMPEYGLSVCSGDFNHWTRKVADPKYPRGFMRSIEWEMPYWNLGNTFDYSEMAALIFPRPFFVERGHHDRVAPDSWVAYEYAKVRALYARFGLAERTGIEFFHGGHSVNGQGAFEFLDRWLSPPAP